MRNDLLQGLCIFVDDIFRDYVRQRQNAIQPIEKARKCLVVFVLFLQELGVQALPFASEMQAASTNLKRNLCNIEGSRCKSIHLKRVNVLLVSMGED